MKSTKTAAALPAIRAVSVSPFFSKGMHFNKR